MAIGLTSFPDENVSREVKQSKEWLLQFARASFNIYSNINQYCVGWRSREDIQLIKAYANGRQPVGKYKKIIALDKDPNNNQMQVRWDILPIIPKYRRIALGLLEKVNYKLRIDPVDPLANEEIEDEIYRMRAKILTRDFMVMMNMQSNAAALQPEPDEPEDLDGLAAMEMGARHRTAMEAEQLVELIFNANNYDFIRQQIREDLFDAGFAVLKDFKQGNTVGVRRCDPKRMIISYCHYPDFRDLKYCGEVEMIQASKIVAESNGELTKDDIKRVWEMGNLRNGIYNTQQNYSGFEEYWNSGQLAVLDLEIYTTDTIEREEKVDKAGNVRVWNPTKDKKGNVKKREGYKYHSKKVQNVYRVKWIVETDMVYDCGQQYDIKRPKDNRACAIGSYHLFGCSLDEMKAFSRTKSLITYADTIQVAAYRLQHALNIVVPKGYAIDFDQLEALDIGAGGSSMTPRDILDMFFNRGILVYRSLAMDGQKANSNLPIIPLDGGVGNEIQEFWTVVQNNIELMRTTLGLNELTDGSTPNPKLLTTVADAATNGTNNALSDLFYGEKHLTQSLAKSVIIRAQGIIANGDDEVFVNALGQGTVQILRSIKDIHKYVYAVKIEDLPSQEEIQVFNVLVNTALAEKQITVADVMRLNNISNLKQKELFLAYRVKKNLERQQKDALEQQKQNGEIQVQSAQAAAQMEQQTLQMKYDFELRNGIQLEEAKRNTVLIQVNGMLEGKRIDASGRVESSFVQAKGRDESNMRDNATALIKEGKDAEVEKINIPADLQSRVEPSTTSEDPMLDLGEFSFLPDNQELPMEAA